MLKVPPSLYRALEMAEEFPDTDVTGIDIVQPGILQHSSVVIPPNCVLKVADATTEIKKYHEAFDIIHFRAAHLGMPNFAKILLEDTANALKPGGLLLLVHCVPVRHFAYCCLNCDMNGSLNLFLAYFEGRPIRISCYR